MIRNNNDINAILLAIYIWMFIILRVIWSFNSDYSMVVLVSISIIIIIISMIYSEKFINKTFLIGLGLISILVFSILLDILVRDNDVIGVRLYQFLINGVMPIALLAQIRDFKDFFKAYIVLSLLVFLLYFMDPFNDFVFSSGYMVFGFQAMLPVFYGLHIGRIEFKQKFLGILELVTFILIVIFGNRMAGISCVLFFIITDFWYKEYSLKKVLKYTFLSISCILLIMNLKTILGEVINLISEKGYSSYSMNALLYYLNGTIESLSSERKILWANAIELIKLKPIIGYGVGYFESIYGIYVHNFILEILLSNGIIGFAFFSLMLLNSLHKIKKSDKYLKLFGILIFCTSFPKLFTSIYIFIEPTFWMFVFYGLFVPIYNKMEKLDHTNKGSSVIK